MSRCRCRSARAGSPREWLPDDPPDRRRISVLRDWLDAGLKVAAKQLSDCGKPDLVAATSKTFRSLARLTGAAPSSAGPRVRRELTSSGLRQLIAFISRMTTSDRAELEGVSNDRARPDRRGRAVLGGRDAGPGHRYTGNLPVGSAGEVILRRLDTGLQ